MMGGEDVALLHVTEWGPLAGVATRGHTFGLPQTRAEKARRETPAVIAG